MSVIICQWSWKMLSIKMNWYASVFLSTSVYCVIECELTCTSMFLRELVRSNVRHYCVSMFLTFVRQFLKCLWVRTNAFELTWVYVFVSMCTFEHVWEYVGVCLCVSECLCVWTFMRVGMCLCVSVCAHLCVYMLGCVHECVRERVGVCQCFWVLAKLRWREPS